MTNENTKFPNQKRGPRSNPDSVSIGDTFGRWTVIGPYSRYGKDNRLTFLVDALAAQKKI